MRNIMDRSDIISLGLGCTDCLDELSEEFSSNPKSNSRRREVLEIFKDSIDLYCKIHNNSESQKRHLKTSSVIPPNYRYFVFINYEEIYILNEFLGENRKNKDLTIEQVHSNLDNFLNCTDKKQKEDYAKKLIPFFLGIGKKCNWYTERPPVAFMRGYIPPGLIKMLMKGKIKG